MKFHLVHLGRSPPEKSHTPSFSATIGGYDGGIVVSDAQGRGRAMPISTQGGGIGAIFRLLGRFYGVTEHVNSPWHRWRATWRRAGAFGDAVEDVAHGNFFQERNDLWKALDEKCVHGGYLPCYTLFNSNTKPSVKPRSTPVEGLKRRFFRSDNKGLSDLIWLVCEASASGFRSMFAARTSPLKAFVAVMRVLISSLESIYLLIYNSLACCNYLIFRAPRGQKLTLPPVTMDTSPGGNGGNHGHFPR